MSNHPRSLRHWAMDFLSDITPPRPSGKVGRMFYLAWEALMLLVYYFIFRFFLRLTVPFLIGSALMAECLAELPLLPGLIGAAMAAALLGFYANEFYSVEEMRKKLAEPSYRGDGEYLDEDDLPEAEPKLR